MPRNISFFFTQRLQGVVIENRHYMDAMLQHDTPKTLYYLDPTYVHSTRNLRRGNAYYYHEMDDAAHYSMSVFLNSCIKGMVVVSGYPSQLYDNIFEGWHRYERRALADGAAERVECIWLNESANRSIKQKTLFHG